LLGARECFNQQRKRFKTGGEVDRMIGDFADADNDGDAVIG
jgi:hypothetical protein